jgi:RNA polymerase sigma-70 factor (ECF subfamily)
MVYGIAMTHVRNPADADDVFQDVFLIYFQKPRTFREPEHEKAWLINTTLNRCRKMTGSLWRRVLPLDEAPEQSVPFRSREENELYIALRALPEKYRSALHLFYFEDMPVDRIAKALGAKPGAVRMRLTRGRELLRKQLKGEFDFEDR